MNKRGRPPHPDILTPREWEVLEHIREGRSNEEIAERLGISLSGVKYHVSEILGKLSLENRSDAARWAESDVRERRPWWMAATAPLLFWRKLSFGWLSTVLAGGLAVGVAAGIGVLVWALLATTGDSDRLVLPPGDMIAYVATDTNLWVLEGDGRTRRLTDEGAVSAPEWSPYGEWLTYLRSPYVGMEGLAGHPYMPNQRWFIRVDGSGAHQLDQMDSMDVIQVDWSPDASAIACAVEGRLWVGPPDGPSRELSTLGLSVQQGPVWSPDGERIAFTVPLNGLWDIDADGGKPQQIVSREQIEQLLLDEGIAAAKDPASGSGTVFPRNVQSVRWSPDGQSVAFSVQPLPEEIFTGLAPDAALLLTVQRDGTGLSAHTFSTTGFDWAPKGSSLVLTDSGARTERFRQTVIEEERHLVLAAPGQSSLEVLTRPRERTDLWPRWSPDGSRIAFEASAPAPRATPKPGQANQSRRWTEGPQEGIWVLDVESSELSHIASAATYFERAPQWSADGSLLLYVRRESDDVDAPCQLWLVRPDGSEPTELLAEFRGGGAYSRYQVSGFDWYRVPVE